MKKPLPAGVYRFKCVINDGVVDIGSEEVQIAVKAHEFPKVVPAIGPVGALAALGIAVVASAAVSRRRRE